MNMPNVCISGFKSAAEATPYMKLLNEAATAAENP